MSGTAAPANMRLEGRPAWVVVSPRGERMRIRTFVVSGLAVLGVACGGASDAPKPAASPGGTTVNSVTQSGDVLMSGNLGVSAGKLTITLAAVRDPDNASQPANPANVTFSIAAAPAALSVVTGAGTVQRQALAAPSLSCSVGQATSSAAMADIAFINDTTGSMSGTVVGIADSIGSFAAAIAARVDARFAMYTYGDAFATKAESGSEFTKGLGVFGLPEIDDVERPYLGLSGLADFNAFLAELKSSLALGSGGNDEPENTICTLDYAYQHLAFRPGAAKVFVVIGDNPSHQGGDGDVDSWPVQFKPTTGAELVSRLGGAGTIHVVGNDTGSSAPYYNLKTLADLTGGGFMDLPWDGYVNLNSLRVQDWLTNSFAGGCSTAPAGRYLVIVNVTVVGSGGTTKTGTLTFDVTVS